MISKRVVPILMTGALALVPALAQTQPAQTQAAQTQAAQTPPAQTGSLAVAGYPGSIPVLKTGGHSYIDIETLARLTGASLKFRGDQVILTMPAARAAAAAPANNAPKGDFSVGFQRSVINAVAAIRDWRSAIVDAQNTSNPIRPDWTGRYSRNAHTRVALAATAVETEADRKVVPMLQNELSTMQALSDRSVQLQAEVRPNSVNSFTNRPVDTKVLACADALSTLISSNQYKVVSACQ